MAEGLVRKKRRRSGHKAVVTKRLQELEDALAAEALDDIKLKQLNLTFQEKLETLGKLDEEIFDLIEDEDTMVLEIEQADDFKQSIYEAIAKIDKCSVNEPPASHAGTPRLQRPKLPELTLHKFNGDVTKWVTFWDTYDSAVHQNDDLSDIDKFTYLKSLVELSAKEAISGLTLTSANYTEAISVLQKRFENKQRIISKHMDALLNVETVSSAQNIAALRRLFDSVESHVRGLKALGVTSESYSVLLTPVLIRKLPQELCLIVSRETDEEWELDNLMETLEKELQVRERTAAPIDHNKPRIWERPTAAALFAGGRDISCTFCQQGHTSESCRIVSQVEDRKQLLMKTGRCFICLRRGHLSRDCQSSIKCSKCRGRHHVSICYKSKSNASQHIDTVTKNQVPRQKWSAGVNNGMQ
jgi:hypothetical protein